MTISKACFVGIVTLAMMVAVGAMAQRQSGQSFAVSYGIVDRIDLVKVGDDGQPTGAATGAVIGGLAGAYNSSHDSSSKPKVFSKSSLVPIRAPSTESARIRG